MLESSLLSLHYTQRVTLLETLHVWSAALLFWTLFSPRRPAGKRQSRVHTCVWNTSVKIQTKTNLSDKHIKPRWRYNWSECYLGCLAKDINHYFDRQPWSNFLHSLYTPPVRLRDKVIADRKAFQLSQYQNCKAPSVVKPTHLVIVAFGKEQGTELAVQRCLVGLVAMFG